MLQFETGYTDKQGIFQNFKYPQLEVMGKLMDQDESHTFVVLSDEINIRTNTAKVDGVMKTINNYSLFVKYPDQDQAFSLKLSEQAYGAIVSLHPKKGSKLTITKGYKLNEKNGAQLPCIVASVEFKGTPLPRLIPTNAQAPAKTAGTCPGINQNQSTLPRVPVQQSPVKTQINQVPTMKSYPGVAVQTNEWNDDEFIMFYIQDNETPISEKTVQHFIGRYIMNRPEYAQLANTLEKLYKDKVVGE